MKNFLTSIIVLIGLGSIFYSSYAIENCCNKLQQISDVSEENKFVDIYLQTIQCCQENNLFLVCLKCAENLTKKNKAFALAHDYFYARLLYERLKFLEKKQLWDEYFAKGSDYRNQIEKKVTNVIKNTQPNRRLYFLSHLLAYQFYKEQEDAFVEEALTNLINAVQKFAAETENFSDLEYAISVLVDYSEIQKARIILKLYLEHFLKNISNLEDIRKKAEKYLTSGQVELAEEVFDVYLMRLQDQKDDTKLRNEIEQISKFFYNRSKPLDAQYVEKLLSLLEEKQGKNAFSEELLFLRATNLERLNDWQKARKMYLDFLEQFPSSPKQAQVIFKVGLISAYCLRDLTTAKEYFQKLNVQEDINPYTIGSLYQLGILAQWQNDIIQAKAIYQKLGEKVKQHFPQTKEQLQRRMSEIENNKELNLRIKEMLDVALSEPSLNVESQSVTLLLSKYSVAVGEEVNIEVNTISLQTGCLPLQTEYYWSGDVQENIPPDTKSLHIFFPEAGTKIVGILVKTATGILGKAIVFIEVE